MKKIRPFLFVCMFVLLSLSLTACAGRKNGNMNGTEQNSATSSAASETGNGTGAGTGENGMNGDTASGWGEGENGTMTGGTNGEIETTGEGLLDDLTDDLSRGASDAARVCKGTLVICAAVMTVRRKMKILFPGSFLLFFTACFTLEGTIKIFYNKTGVRGKGLP